MFYLRLISLVWLSAWVLAVPLVHVHPEADHQHGQASHIHGGITHSVFSADLPCEYHAGSPGGASHIASPLAHEFDHPEIGFSLLTSSPDRSAGKPAFFSSLSEATVTVPVELSSIFLGADPADSDVSVVPLTCLSPRAPPVTA
ncbi:MAG: hypothetical protein EPO02_10130 [Nitrospirae bacterium]|nr:MAG: hypothetical protein EPO02_10130 [Nitrospirota bacterium]